jgi:hypothetical protein
LVNLVSVLIDHDNSEANTGLVKGQAAVSERLFAMVEEQSIYCIEQGMGEQVASALQRLTTSSSPDSPTVHHCSAPRHGRRHRSSLRAVPPNYQD